MDAIASRLNAGGPAAIGTSAAPTELPAGKTVNPAAGIGAPRNDPRLAQNARHGVIGPQVRAVLDRLLNARAGSRACERALLRQRAYVRAQSKENPAAWPPVDATV